MVGIANDEALHGRALRSGIRLRSHRVFVAATDIAVLLASTLLSQFIRFGVEKNGLEFGIAGISYTTFSVILTVLWVFALLIQRVGRGDEYLTRSANGYLDIGRATGVTIMVMAVYSGIAQLQISRGYLLVALPLGFLALVVNRWAWRSWISRQRARGRFSRRTVLVGASDAVEHFDELLDKNRSSGLHVVGTVITASGAGAPTLAERRLTAPGVFDRIESCSPEVVIIIGDAGQGAEFVRELSWTLEGSQIKLMVSPRLGPVANSRIQTVTVADHQMVYVQTPQYGGPKFLLKRGFDIFASAVGLVVLFPILVALSALVRIDSPGGALFVQNRIGRRGVEFPIYKFRTMVHDAEARRAELVGMNEHEGPMFKIRDDPRVTRVGRFLRKYSLDELPQLLNVFIGDMSLVGPRPPLASEVESYEAKAHRRLLLRPGLTGLWQVSGRSDLTWEDGLSLDLYYVENWSFLGDVSLILKTVGTVIRPKGAY